MRGVERKEGVGKIGEKRRERGETGRVEVRGRGEKSERGEQRERRGR